ncbi:hypothetical protein [Streptomyces sp. H27-H5]|uniref:hypothetical protein n=1 Tax=Streptomyces sp. H27-H5 TaxID=2996460 RepID=UPI00226E6029|nr:hypothetical protein [Streptomyces sp. H27-H5]MCY0961990.1 hypothetical protein [Streptomyces sp. H27-H5]
MGGKQDKRQEPGKGREEQQRPQRPGQDPVHPEPRTPSRGGERHEDVERRREEDAHDDRYLRDDAF